MAEIPAPLRRAELALTLSTVPLLFTGVIVLAKGLDDVTAPALVATGSALLALGLWVALTAARLTAHLRGPEYGEARLHEAGFFVYPICVLIGVVYIYQEFGVWWALGLCLLLIPSLKENSKRRSPRQSATGS